MQKVPKRKILIIVPTISAGGSERFVSILYNQLDRTRFDVKLAILDSTTVFYDLEYKENIIFLNRKEVRSSFLALLGIIKSHAPNIIFSTITSLNILLSFIRICYPKFLLIIRESTILSTHFRNFRNSFVYEFPIKLFYKFADKIVCQSEDMSRDMHHSYRISANKLIVINNPALVNKFKLKNSNKNDKPKLITIARLDKAKGYDRILRALSLVKTDFEYIIVGDFDNKMLRNSFNSLVSELNLGNKIKLVGVTDKPEEYLQEADLYIHGSYYEGFPNVLLEAGLVGLPVISFLTAGVNEILVNEVNSYIVADNDLKAFSEAIDRALKSRFDKEEIRRLITTRFDSKRIVEKYEELFSSIK